MPPKLRRQFEEALVDGQVESALGLLAPFLETGGAQDWADAGFLLDDLGEAEAAMHHYDRALSLDATCAAAYIGRGKLRANQKDYAGAEADIDQALALRPTDGLTWFLKSSILDELGRPTEAEACRAKALAVDPKTFGR